MLIRWCSGHPFFDLHRLLHSLFPSPSFLFSLSLPPTKSRSPLFSFSFVRSTSPFGPYTVPQSVSLSRFCFQARSTRFLFACVTGTTTIIAVIVVVVCPSVHYLVPRAAEKSMSDKRPFIACTMLLLISIARVIFSPTP